MSYYVLYNSHTKQYLEHPLVGIWSTDDRAEADDMLAAASAFAGASGYATLGGKLCIKKVGRGFDPLAEEIKEWAMMHGSTTGSENSHPN